MLSWFALGIKMWNYSCVKNNTAELLQDYIPHYKIESCRMFPPLNKLTPIFGTYMYQRNGSAWALVMVCHLSRNKPLPVELQLTCQLHLENKLQRNSNLTREFSLKKIGLKIESVLLKGPTHHAYAWPIGSFWQDTFDLMTSGKCRFCSDIGVLCQSVAVATLVHGNEYTSGPFY